MKKSQLIQAGFLVLMLQAAQASEPEALSAREQLGQMIFFDTRLSEPAGQACASCHAPGRAFSDPEEQAPTSKGVLPGRMGSRNTPSVMYARYSPAFHFDPKEEHYVGGQFWDGRAATLEEQAKAPFLDPLEMANPDRQSVVKKVRTAGYAPLFEAVFGKDALTGPCMHNGYFRTLEGVMAFYNSRDNRALCKQPMVDEDEAMKRKCWPTPEVIANVNREELGRLGLTRREEDIVAFMKTLTDGYRPGQ